MKLKSIIKLVILSLTLLCTASCSKSQEGNSLPTTSAAISDTGLINFDESTASDMDEFKTETEPDLSESNVAFPFITFSNNELSTENASTDGTLLLLDEKESTLKEYSVSCLYGYLDKVQGVRRGIADNQFTYTISSNMEEDVITIKVFGDNSYKATTYFFVKKAINKKGMSIFTIKKMIF